VLYVDTTEWTVRILWTLINIIWGWKSTEITMNLSWIFSLLGIVESVCVIGHSKWILFYHPYS
jgi:hypothetical protein